MGKSLKEALRRGDVVVGMTVYTYCPAVIDALGNWGFDFAFIDAEHTPITVDQTMEKLVMAAKLSGVSPLVRVKGLDDVDIRKALEFGADGVIIPHVKNKAQAEKCVEYAKFPPLGRRGADATVRSARYAGPGFSWEQYIKDANENTLVIPMYEDWEFDAEVDGVLSVPGIDAINFGPTDYALSLNMALFYKLDEPRIKAALENLTAKARPKGIGVMAPAVPPTLENCQRLVEQGVNMLILGSDMFNFQAACKTIMNDCVAPLRKGMEK